MVCRAMGCFLAYENGALCFSMASAVSASSRFEIGPRGKFSKAQDAAKIAALTYKYPGDRVQETGVAASDNGREER
jgi:hypothetical protein